jgi:hypothetical protein
MLFTQPLFLIVGGVDVRGELGVAIILGPPDPRGGIEHQAVRLTLQSPIGHLVSPGTSGWFEDELLDLQRRLQPEASLKACITCAFSDYSPYGNGMFGWLACFRGNKAAYTAVKSKLDLFRIWDTATDLVQETYLCPEFRVRLPGTGYRG